MERVTIKRVASLSSGTFGVLLNEEGIPLIVTLENPWDDNKKFVSCIPAGTYLCKRRLSPKFGDTFHVTKVPNRSHIVFHWGNRIKNTLGCILTGEKFGRLYGDPAVLASMRAFETFKRETTHVNKFTLEILEV